MDTFEKELKEADIVLDSAPADYAVFEPNDILDQLKSNYLISMAFLPAEALIQANNANDFIFTEITQQPGFIDDLAQNFAIQDSVIGDLIANELSANGLELVSFWSRQPKNLFTPTYIATASELAGKKILQLQGMTFKKLDGAASSVSGEALYTSGATAEVLEGLGATASELASGEFVGAMELGVADVVIGNSLDQWASFGSLDPLIDGTLVSNLSHEQGYLVASEEWWTGLSQASRNSISNAAQMANAAARQVLLLEEREREENAKKFGIKYTSVSDLGWDKLRSVSEANWLSSGDVDAKKNSLETFQEVLEEIKLKKDQGNTLERRGDVDPVILFATNRNDEKTVNLADRFGILKTNENRLSCGVISFEPNESRKLGKPFGGRIHLTDELIWSGSDGCAQLLSASLVSGQKLTIYIHGFANTFEDAVRRGISIKSDFGIADPLLVWAWPSKGSSGGYIFDLNSVAYSEKYIDQFVDALEQDGLLEDVTIIAHSMGSKMAANLLEKVRFRNKKIANLVFVAPDFPPSLFEQFLARNEETILLRTLYANQYDRALWLSSKMNGEIPVGLGGKHLKLVDDIETVDVSNVATGGLSNHSHGFDVREVIIDVSTLVRERRTANQRNLDELVSEGKSYWMIPDD